MGPLDYITIDALQCQWDAASFFLFSDNVFSPLIYYSHLFPAIAGLILAVIIWSHTHKSPINNVFATIALLFSTWSLLDLVLWASERPDVIMFVWSSLIYFEVLIYAACLYLAYLFFDKADPPFKTKVLAILLTLPPIILAPTSLNLIGIDYTNCDREAIEGPLWHFYTYAAELIFACWIVVLGMERWRTTKNPKHRKEITIFTTGIMLFLLTFSWGNIVGSLSEDWAVAQYGLFGMPIFLAFIIYLIVRFQAFNTKILGTEALVLSLWVLLLSLLFLQTIDTARPIIMLTLLLFGLLGVQLVRGVKREIEQRVYIEALARDLAVANDRLKELDRQKTEFVSIASHQLRSPLTAMTGYASLLLDGDLGEISKEAREAILKIFESGKSMAVAIDDFLNVTRIEQGRMQYTMEEFAIHDLAKQVIAELSIIADRKKLILDYESDVSGVRIYGDQGKVKQILTNIVDNAIKYTPGGKVSIRLTQNTDAKTISVAVTDSGIGLSDIDIQKLFGKFSRAENANTVSVRGTGLGLFIAREMAHAHGGEITVTSPGRGKGTTFTLTLPERASTPVSGKKSFADDNESVAVE